jgi:hypothetical protein
MNEGEEADESNCLDASEGCSYKCGEKDGSNYSDASEGHTYLGAGSKSSDVHEGYVLKGEEREREREITF